MGRQMDAWEDEEMSGWMGGRMFRYVGRLVNR